MASQKSRAIVLRRVEFSESSYVATLYTEDFGKLTGLAKGARRPKSSFEGALDLLSVCRVVFIPKSSDALALLTEATLEKPFRSSIRCLKRLYAGYYAAELTLALTDDRDPNPILFRTLLRTLISLDGDGCVSFESMRFELMTLKILGHLPSFALCSSCGRDVAGQSRVSFSPTEGGVLCPECRTAKRHLISVSRQAITTLNAIAGEAPDAGSPTEREVTGEMRSIMNRYICHVLGRRPRMFDYLGYS
jgi:DNA repair protein RecO (recombination protein O)